MGRGSRAARSITIAIALAVISAQIAAAQPALPSTFKSQIVHSPAGADIFVRSAGHGPVVVLIHGYAETSDSWSPLASELEKTYTVVVPDLRGIGSSSRPAGGYDKKTELSSRAKLLTHFVSNAVEGSDAVVVLPLLKERRPAFAFLITICRYFGMRACFTGCDRNGWLFGGYGLSGQSLSGLRG